jgi:hypothetical protein
MRLEGEVVYTDRPSKPEVFWIEVQERFAPYLSQSGNPWLACLLPLAMTLHEPLQLPIPIDRQLHENAGHLMQIWAKWYPDRQVIPIEADFTADDHMDVPDKTGVFFSGGVDSFFTTLHYDEQATERSLPSVDDLITVWGFDIPIDNQLAFNTVQRDVGRVARLLKKDLIVVKTNARETRLSQMHWLSHFGSLLIGVGLSLERRYTNILITSAEGRKYQKPVSGSHPLTDPLLSTSRTTVVHYGEDRDRFERTDFVSHSAIAMDTLRVCWESSSGVNCGKCDKCYRTMAALDILGRLHQCATLPADEFDASKLERIYSGHQRAYYLSLREHARDRDRADIVNAIDKSLARSKRLDALTQLPRLQRANQMLKSSFPFVWLLLWPIRYAAKTILKQVTGASI